MATLSVWWELLAWRPAAQCSGLSGCLAFAHGPVLPRAPIGYPFQKFSPRVAKNKTLPWGEGENNQEFQAACFPRTAALPKQSERAKTICLVRQLQLQGRLYRKWCLNHGSAVNLLLQLIHNEQKAS